MFRRSLRAQILLLIAGTVAGLVLVVLVALSLFARREIERGVRADVRAANSVLAQLVCERGEALTTRCQLLATQPAFKYLLDPGVDRETVAGYARDNVALLRADVVQITDRSGMLRGESAPSGLAANRRTEAGIAAALRGRTWTGVVIRDGRLMLSVSVPVMDPVSRTVQMTLTACKGIDSAAAQDLKRTLGSDMAFVWNGRVVGASLPTPPRIPAPAAAPQQIALRGRVFFALYAPLPGADPGANIGFVTLQSYDRAMATYHRLRNAFLSVSLFALLLALAAGLLVSHGLTRPLDGVAAAARVLREGGWPAPFAIRRADEIGLLQLVFNEMTDALRNSRERLLALLDTDPLTELDNHRRFQERLAQETARSQASGEPLCLLLLDLDRFGNYNQRLGHAAGDQALRRVAGLVRGCLPRLGIAARFGGEEFAVILPRHRIAQAGALAEEIRAAVCAATNTENSEALSLSAGCAEFGTHSSQAEGLVLAAELAVSQAKHLGRNRVCRFDSVPGADQTADPYQLYAFLKDGSLATIQALAAAVDAKDPYTQGHSQRVAEYAADLARHIGLSAHEVDQVHITGTLHDVGKIGVPDAVLKKPGPLDATERAVIETHPALGEIIVRKAPQLAATLPGVRHHHERWDGQGYPDGLAGDDIPFIARLLALADTFDAMTSDRPYRPGLASDIALREVSRGAGRQFDPRLAEAFVAMMSARHLLAHAA